MARLLDPSSIEQALADLPGWTRDGETLRKHFELASFADAIAFVVRVGFVAEAMNHHPDVDVRWRRVTCVLTTHDSGGVTDLDVELAHRIEDAA